MSVMASLGKWFLLLSKRLYKKLSFVVLLVLIPVCIVTFRFVAKQDSGFVHVILSQHPGGNETQIIESLLNEKGAILFSKADSVEAAEEAVRTGQADEAWIFPAHILADTQDFHHGAKEYVVQVITREDRMALRLSREKISAVLYGTCARIYYLDYLRANFAQLNGLSDRDLLVYFEQQQISEDLFVYGNPADQMQTAENYLTSPLRGLLAILMLLCGMAATMYYMQDTAAGTFSFVKQRLRGAVALGSVMTAVVNVSAIVLLSLHLSSLAGNLVTEIAMLLAYALSCSAFCLLLKALFPNIHSYCAMLPLITVIMLGICPVFFDFRKLSVIQRIFPPTYYINGVYDSRNLLYMVGYSGVCLFLCWILQKLKSFAGYRK